MANFFNHHKIKVCDEFSRHINVCLYATTFPLIIMVSDYFSSLEKVVLYHSLMINLPRVSSCAQRLHNKFSKCEFFFFSVMEGGELDRAAFLLRIMLQSFCLWPRLNFYQTSSSKRAEIRKKWLMLGWGKLERDSYRNKLKLSRWFKISI